MFTKFGYTGSIGAGIATIGKAEDHPQSVRAVACSWASQTRKELMAAKKGEQKSLKLSAVLDLNEASNLKANLMSLRGDGLAIDASGVERIGTQCAQILVAGAKAWEADQKPFSYQKASDAFLKTLQLIGVNVDHLLAKEIRQ